MHISYRDFFLLQKQITCTDQEKSTMKYISRPCVYGVVVPKAVSAARNNAEVSLAMCLGVIVLKVFSAARVNGDVLLAMYLCGDSSHVFPCC